MRLSGSARHRIAVLLRGLRWRGESTVVLFVVAIAACTAAAVGPVYLGAASASVLRQALVAAPVYDSGLSISALPGTKDVDASMSRAETLVPKGPDGTSLFGSPIATFDDNASIAAFRADVISRTGICQNIVFVSGGCPSNAHDVAVTDRSAASLRVRVGSTLSMEVASIGHHVNALELHVVGVFRPPSVKPPYWWGYNYFQFGTGSLIHPLLDDFVVAPVAFANDSALTSGSQALQLQLPANIDSLQADGVGPAGAAVGAFESVLRAPAYGLGVGTNLLGMLSAVGNSQHLMTTVVEVVDLELVLLALCVLYATVARTSEARESEINVARLRGFPLRSMMSVAVAEPAVVILVAVPIGVLLAWAAVALSAPSLFAAGTSVGVGDLAIGAAAAAAIGGVAAISLGSWRIARATAKAGSDRYGARAAARRQGALDLAAIALAAAALVELGASGVLDGNRPNPVAAFAPGLIALGLAVLGLRIVPIACRGMMRLTRDTKLVASFLVVRQISRRPFLLRQIVLVAVAFSLLCFAASGWVVARSNRALQANFSVGAAEVATVSLPPGANIETDVRAADPSGRQAMAVATFTGNTGVLLAVDSTRLASVASWPLGLTGESAAAVAMSLRGDAVPAVLLAGSALRVEADLSRRVSPPVSLEVTVFNPAYQATATVDLGALRPGEHVYQASLEGNCLPSCRLVSLTPSWVPPGSSTTSSPGEFSISLGGFAERSGRTWSGLGAELAAAGSWTEPTGVTLAVAGGRLELAFSARAYGQAAFGIEPAIAVRDVPAQVPAVATGDRADPTNGDTADVEGLDGNSITIVNRLDVSLLPAVGSDATMIDLTYALDSMTEAAPYVTYEVWLAAGASPTILAQLAKDGIKVLRVETAAGVAASLGRQGVSLAYDLFLFAAVAAGLLAAGSTLFAIRVAARRRSAELAALQAVGVSRRALRRTVLAESGIVLAIGTALGIAAGLIAVGLALPSVPEFSSTVGLAPLRYGVPLATLALVVAAAFVLMVLAITGAGVATMARVRPERLRTDTT